MPKVPTDYSKTCIYKLVHKEDYNNENIYVGSTTNFTKRKDSHKSSCNLSTNRKYNQLKYTYIRNNGGWDMWYMIEIEKYPCNDKREGETRERYWIEHLKSNLNQIIPTRTNQEYFQDHYEHYAKYRIDNKEQINARVREYCTKNKEVISDYKKKYREKNKETMKEYKKKYYQNNKEHIAQNNKEKVICECGCEVLRICLAKHQKTDKHLQLLNSILQETCDP